MDMETQAYRLGYDAGKSAASWVFDGNTTRATYEWALKGIEEGDPEVLDSIGEYLQGFTVIRNEDLQGYDFDELDEAVEDWDAGASDGFWHEIERAARYQLED